MFEIPVIKGLTENQVLTLMNCRKLSQYTTMWNDYHAGKEGKCPFCDPLGEKNVVIKVVGNWRMWENPFPLDYTMRHFVLAPTQHITDHRKIHELDFASIGDLFMWAVREFNLPGGALAMRFGPPKWNAGSVLHLHANIIVPNGDGAVQVTLAKDREKIQETIKRMLAFEKLRTGSTIDELTNEENVLVEGRLD